MGFRIIWLFLFWPMWMLSTDPQSSPPSTAQEILSILEEKLPPSGTNNVEECKQEKLEIKNNVDESPGARDSPPVETEKKVEQKCVAPELSDSGLDAVSGKNGFSVSANGPINPEEAKTDEKRLEDSELTRGDVIHSQNPVTPSHEQLTEGEYSSLGMETVPGSLTLEEGVPEQTGSVSEEDENATAAGTEIPSFSEWTKLQLSKKQDQNLLLQTNGAVMRETVKKEDGKNFASPDCGAKILLANPEAQNPYGTISSSHDEYMLNRCGVSSWLIMELCEPIRIEKIAIGNLELFSSSPKEIDVGVSERYPTREWLKIGPLELPDARAAHAFPVKTNSTYSKFIRIQILSHHGNEHYCPLSVIRIYGKSEYEMIETDHSVEVDPSDKAGSAVGEEPVNNEGTNEKSVIGTAADAVISIVKKAAQVLGKRGSSSTTNTTNCESVASCISPAPNVTDVCNRKLLYFVHANSHYFANNASCRSLLNIKSIGGPSQVEGFWVALFGDGILHSVCKYMSPLRACDDQETDTVEEKVKALNGNATLKSNHTADPVPTTTQQPNQESSQSVAPDLNGVVDKSPPLAPLPSVVVVEEESRIQKESVFVRLTNRIKTLERNQSLSSGYLEELSQRFKKQSEESYSVSQTLKKTLNETISKYIWLQEFTRRESNFLKRSVADLRVTLWRTEMQRGFLIFVVLVQFCGIALFCCWTRRRLSDLDERITMVAKKPMPAPAIHARKESQLPVLPRKRSNSHPDIMKLKKKKKKKDGLKNPSANVFTFMPHSATSPDSLGGEPKSSTPNGILLSNNSTNYQQFPPLTPVFDSDPINVNSANRFGILASPSTHTMSSVESVVSLSVGSNIEVHHHNGMKKPLAETNNVMVTNGHKSTGSASSLESTGGKSGIKGSKKMKLKNFIPKLFEK